MMTRLNSIQYQKIESEYQVIPVDYRFIMKNYGWGNMMEATPGEVDIPILTILKDPESAIKETYKDDEILKLGAKGDIIIVASEFDGTAYGFDVGMDWMLSRVEVSREVEHLEMTFSELFFSFLACDSDIIRSFEDGFWVGIDGDRYPVSLLYEQLC
ncbi:MAG: hypothetical protein AAGD13_08890 [Pseudomonadota bacterium]